MKGKTLHPLVARVEPLIQQGLASSGGRRAVTAHLLEITREESGMSTERYVAFGSARRARVRPLR